MYLCTECMCAAHECILFCRTIATCTTTYYVRTSHVFFYMCIVVKGKNHLHVSLLSFQFLLFTECFVSYDTSTSRTRRYARTNVCLCAKGTHVSFCVLFCLVLLSKRKVLVQCEMDIIIQRVRVRQTSVRIDKIIIITHFVSKYKHFFKSLIYCVCIFMLASHVTQLFLPTLQQQQWNIFTFYSKGVGYVYSLIMHKIRISNIVDSDL